MFRPRLSASALSYSAARIVTPTSEEAELRPALHTKRWLCVKKNGRRQRTMKPKQLNCPLVVDCCMVHNSCNSVILVSNSYHTCVWWGVILSDQFVLSLCNGGTSSSLQLGVLWPTIPPLHKNYCTDSHWKQCSAWYSIWLDASSISD